MHLWHNGMLPSIFDTMFRYAGNIDGYNTRYASGHNLYKARVKTNIGKQLISFMAIDFWNSIPIDLKYCRKTFSVFKKFKNHLLNQQKS
jgi:hypothetical protein